MDCTEKCASTKGKQCRMGCVRPSKRLFVLLLQLKCDTGPSGLRSELEVPGLGASACHRQQCRGFPLVPQITYVCPTLVPHNFSRRTEAESKHSDLQGGRCLHNVTVWVVGLLNDADACVRTCMSAFAPTMFRFLL